MIENISLILLGCKRCFIAQIDLTKNTSLSCTKLSVDYLIQPGPTYTTEQTNSILKKKRKEKNLIYRSNIYHFLCSLDTI